MGIIDVYGLSVDLLHDVLPLKTNDLCFLTTQETATYIESQLGEEKVMYVEDVSEIGKHYLDLILP